MFGIRESLSRIDWKIYIVIFLLVLIILWIFLGNEGQEFIGLAPILDDSDLSESSESYLNIYDNMSSEDSDPSYTSDAENVTYVNNLMLSEDQSSEAYENKSQYTIKRRRKPSTKKFKPVTSPEIAHQDNIIKMVSNKKKKPYIPQFSTNIPHKKPAKCSTKKCSKGESITCKTLEQIYGVPFITARPDFLKNPETGENLELDCYNEELGIAAEYNGIQHYLWPNYTDQTEEQFHNQLRRDEFKINQCDLNGVYLITVPYEVPYDSIPKYIEYYLPENVAARQAANH